MERNKLNEGALGQGNAYLSMPPFKSDVKGERQEQILKALNDIKPVNATLSPVEFLRSFEKNGGIVELVIGNIDASPSGQAIIYPNGEIQLLSTHEQKLDPIHNQIFIGSEFPARIEYRKEIHSAVRAIGQELYKEGIVGYFGVDFLVSRDQENIFAIEIKLRQGGTTHPRHLVEMATGAHYNQTTGNLETQDGHPIHYVSSDSLLFPAWAGKTITEVNNHLEAHGLALSPKNSPNKGIILVMPSEVSQNGKIGFVAVSTTKAEAEEVFEEAKTLFSTHH